ncbi:MAG TPA: hypothetical protein VF221_00840 [Chloroflexota bacterium]
MSNQQPEQTQDRYVQRFAHLLGQIVHQGVSCDRCGRRVETEGERTYFFGQLGEGTAEVWCARCTEDLKKRSLFP